MRMKTTSVFEKTITAYNNGCRYIVSKGGTRSSKTYSILQLLTLIASYAKKPLLISVVSETYPHLKRGAIRDFKSIMSADNLWDDNQWNKSDNLYTFRSGGQIEFFSADSPSKVHGPARDILFINECQNIDFETARQLFVRTRGAIFIDYNPTRLFWVDTKIIPSTEATLICSTYKDNEFLTREQVAEIESYKSDEQWWRVYGLGEMGRAEGLIFDFDIDATPEGGNVFYGLDFGFANDPTALVECRIVSGNLYVSELIYETRLTNSDIVDKMKELGVSKSATIWADSAEPKSIEEIWRAGYNIKPTSKGADSINVGIQKVKQYGLKVTADSLNLIKELRNYSWAKDKEGNPMNKPVDVWNHAIDAMRYAVTGQTFAPVSKKRIHINYDN